MGNENLEKKTYSEKKEIEAKEKEKNVKSGNFSAGVSILAVFFLPLFISSFVKLYREISSNGSEIVSSLVIFIGNILLFLIIYKVFLNPSKNSKNGSIKSFGNFGEEESIGGDNFDRVEGIIEGKEFDLIDENNDGKIMIHEFYPKTEQEVLDKILEVDENFSKTEFKSFVKEMFLLIQEAFSSKNYRKIRAFETDALFRQHKAYIDGLVNREEVDLRDSINIKGVLLKDFNLDGSKQVLTVAVTAGMRRTLKDRYSTCNGDVPYILTFVRNNGVKTKANTILSTNNCSNCGAVIDVDDSGVCKYCNTSLVSGECDWVLLDIKNIRIVTE